MSGLIFGEYYIPLEVSMGTMNVVVKSNSKAMYEDKNPEYFGNIRHDIISQIQNAEGKNILEVGSGAGKTLMYIKKNMGAEFVTGIDFVELENSCQKNEAIDQFFITNIEQALPPLKEKYYDTIIFPDVLEHLIDPWKVLNNFMPFLKDNGHIIISIPNFIEISNLLKLIINKSFDYQEEGIMDRTHLRFFALKDLMKLVHKTNLKPVKIVPTFELVKSARKRKFINKITFGLFTEYLTHQYIITAIRDN